MVCMSYQKMDDNMKHYLAKFNEAGTAFILKPEHLRYIPVTIPIPPAQTHNYLMPPNRLIANV